MKKMLIRIVLTFSVLAIISGLLSGCNTDTEQGNSGEKGQTTALSGSLKVYYSDVSEAAYAPIIDQFALKNDKIKVDSVGFKDYEEMNSRLITEFAAGNGPDVVLGGFFLGMDFQAMARNGAFYDMSNLMSKDQDLTNEKYYMPVFKAGQVDEKQLIMPFSFSLATIFVTKEALANTGLKLDGSEPTLTVYDKITEYLKATETETPQIMRFQGGPESVVPLMLASGVDLIDNKNKKALLDSDAFSSSFKLFVETAKHGDRWFKENLESQASYVPYGKVPMLLTHTCCSPNVFRILQSAYAENGNEQGLVAYTIPTQADPSSYRATVETFGTISAKTKNPEAAWDLFRMIIDREQGYNSLDGMTINKTIMNAHLESISSVDGKETDSMRIRKLPQDMTDQLKNVLENINDAAIYQFNSLNTEILNGVLTYLKGEADYDQVVSDLTKKFDLYLAE